ncbi:MAG: HDOD domain-containing protein [Desulfobulbaceae bacterium]|nr:HDOD domain-containing protein [Desulfobulbaceae bacterium]
MTKSSSKELDIEQQINFLKKISFFSTFDDHEIRQFLALSKWLKVPPGTTIIKEGAVERVFYILVKGEVLVYKELDDKGKILELTTLTTGDSFGEMALVGESKRTAGVKTTKSSFILRVEPNIISTSNVFLQLKFYKRFCEIFVTRLVLANQRMSGPATPPPAADATAKPAAKPAAAPAAAPPPPEPAAAPPAAAKPKSPTQHSQVEENIDFDSLPPEPEKKGRISPTKLKRQLNMKNMLVVNKEPADRLERLLASGEENTRALAELIALDPILSCKVLQTANSPFFRRSCEVASVPHAMIIVGIKHIQKMIAETLQPVEIVQSFSGISQLQHRFWKHSIVVARIAQMLKDIIRINTATDIYLAGLLHDIGKLAVNTLEPTFYPQLLKPDSEFRKDRLKKEVEYVGIDHTWPGVWVGEYLSVPQVYLDVILHHHTPEKASGESLLPTALIHLADIFATRHGVCLSGPDSEMMSPMESPVWALIQEHHHPFAEANIFEFITSFNSELSNTWGSITADLD